MRSFEIEKTDAMEKRKWEENLCKICRAEREGWVSDKEEGEKRPLHACRKVQITIGAQWLVYYWVQFL